MREVWDEREHRKRALRPQFIDTQFERETILAELKDHAFNVAETARALGLERSHLYKKCNQLGIEVDKLRGSG